jgi:hypothetical protein
MQEEAAIRSRTKTPTLSLEEEKAVRDEEKRIQEAREELEKATKRFGTPEPGQPWPTESTVEEEAEKLHALGQWLGQMAPSERRSLRELLNR